MSRPSAVLNLGLKSIRAIAFGPDGKKIAASSRPIGTLLRGKRIEQDPGEWFQKAVEVLSEIVDESTGAFSFVTITASSACLVPVDSDGVAIRRAIMVSDGRAAPQALRLGGLSEFEPVANGRAAFAADPYFLLPKAMWLAEEEPHVMARTKWLMTPADYLAFQLTGECATDPLNAEKFYFDVDGGRYPVELVNAAGIDERLLPPVLPTGEQLGAVHGAAAAMTGIAVGVPVVVSTYDAICAFWGSGVTRIGDVADVSGTVTSIRMLSREPIRQEENRVFSQSMPGSGHYVVGGSNNLGGGLIEWVKQSFYGGESAPYDAILTEAAASGAGARGIVFLPYLLGERCPLWDSEARGVFFGLERQHTRGDLTRAVCEGAAFSVEHVLSVLRENGAVPERLRVSGGLARLGVVNEIKADVTGLPTEVLAEFETTSVGAMMLAGTGQGWFSSLEEAAAIVKIREIVVPDERRNELYREWFGLYRLLYESLGELFSTRTRMTRELGLGGIGRLENL